MLQVPVTPNFIVVITLNVIQGGGADSQFYLIDIGGCWKNNGLPCDGDVTTDVTRYSEMIINPQTASWCRLQLFSLLISNYLSISLRHTSYDFSQMVLVSRVAIQFSRSLEAWSLYVTQFLYIVFGELLAALTASVCVHLTMSQLLMEQRFIVRIQAIFHTLHTISIAPHQMQRMQRPLTWCAILIAIPKHKRLSNYFPTLNGLFMVTLPKKEMAGLVTLAHGHLMWVHSRIASTFIRYILLLSWSLPNYKW